MVRKRSTLPKDFREQLKTASVAEIQAVLERCELDARGEYDKRTALAYRDLPDEVTRWLVERGLDVDTRSKNHNTPLMDRMLAHGDISVLIELGAQVGRPGESAPLWGTLYAPRYVLQLLAAGADATVRDATGRGLIEYALTYAENYRLPQLAETVRILLDAGAPMPTPESAHELVGRLGERFEFARDAFAADSVAETSAAMDALYEMFHVTPVAQRVLHDGVSPIAVTGRDADERYDALFDLLVPASGPAATVQGEVIRITGKLTSEIFRNGGANWDASFREMADALGTFLASGTTVGNADELAGLAHRARFSTVDDDTLTRLRRWAADWVAANPKPLPLAPQPYLR